MLPFFVHSWVDKSYLTTLFHMIVFVKTLVKIIFENINIAEIIANLANIIVVF